MDKFWFGFLGDLSSSSFAGFFSIKLAEKEPLRRFLIESAIFGSQERSLDFGDR